MNQNKNGIPVYITAVLVCAAVVITYTAARIDSGREIHITVADGTTAVMTSALPPETEIQSAERGLIIWEDEPVPETDIPPERAIPLPELTEMSTAAETTLTEETSLSEAVFSETTSAVPETTAAVPETTVSAAETSASSSAATVQETAPPRSSGLININTASAEELTALPGIGEKTAQAIIEYRSIAPFYSIEEIKEVKGIGDKKYEKIKDMITV